MISNSSCLILRFQRCPSERQQQVAIRVYNTPFLLCFLLSLINDSIRKNLCQRYAVLVCAKNDLTLTGWFHVAGRGKTMRLAEKSFESGVESVI